MMLYIHGNRLHFNPSSDDDKRIDFEIEPNIVFCRNKYAEDGKQLVCAFVDEENAKVFCEEENKKDKEHYYWFEKTMFYDNGVKYPNAIRYEVTKNEDNLYLSNKQYLYGVTETKSKYQYYSNDGTVYGFIVPYDCNMEESDFIECVRNL